MPASGRPWRAAEVAEVADAAHGHRLARPLRRRPDLERVGRARGRPRGSCARRVDTVMFCLSKGLAAPIGSRALRAPGRRSPTARDERARLGGGWRQAGVIAAAGIVALETMVERLADDHARARRLADALADRFPGSVDPSTVRDEHRVRRRRPPPARRSSTALAAMRRAAAA